MQEQRNRTPKRRDIQKKERSDTKTEAAGREAKTSQSGYKKGHVTHIRAFFGQPAGHGAVHTDDNHNIIIPYAKAGDNNTYSLLQLPAIRVGGIRRERLSDI